MELLQIPFGEVSLLSIDIKTEKFTYDKEKCELVKWKFQVEDKGRLEHFFVTVCPIYSTFPNKLRSVQFLLLSFSLSSKKK